MTLAPETLANFRADIGDIPCHDDPKYVGLKSRDYYWYSPILSAELDGRTAQLVVQPRTEAEVITIAAAIARHRIPLTIRGGGTRNTHHAARLDRRLECIHKFIDLGGAPTEIDRLCDAL